MVAPLVTAAAIQAGAGVLGGIFDRRSSQKQSKAEIARVEAREDSRFQRSSADAKAAGLHPLFALGAGGAGSPSFIAGQSETGSALGDAVRGIGSVGSAQARSKIPAPTMDPMAQQLLQLQIDNARIRNASDTIDLTEKQKNLSSNQLVTQAATGSQEIQVPVLEAQAAPLQKEVKIHRKSNVVRVQLPFGAHIDIDENINAEDMEMAFGEIGGEIAGLMKLYNSIVETIDRSSWGVSKKRRIKELALVTAKKKANAKPTKAQPATTYPLMP